MDNHQQYRTITVISNIKYILILSILVLLFHESFTSLARAAEINQIIQSSIIFKSIISIGVYFVILYKAGQHYQSVHIENMPLVIVNHILGILALIYGILDFLNVVVVPRCYMWQEKFNRIIVLIFTFILFFFFPFFIKKRPDPDDRSGSITSISAGSFTFVSCFFIFFQSLTLGVKQSILENRNVTQPMCIVSDSFKNFDSIINTLNSLEISYYMFFFISAIFIYFPLQENEKQIIDRQYQYQTMINPQTQNPVNDIPERNFNHCNLQVQHFFATFKSNIIALIIGIGIFFTLIVFAVLCSTAFWKHDQSFLLTLNSNFQIVKIVIYVIILISSFFYWFDVVQWKIEKNIRSKIDEFCINAGTFGQVINGLTVVISAGYMFSENKDQNRFLRLWISAHVFQIVQCLIHRTLIFEILHRHVGDYLDPKKAYDRFWRNQFDPCLILCISNLSFFLINLTIQPVMMDMFLIKKNFIWSILEQFTIPLEILNRIHGFTFLLNVLLKTRCQRVNDFAEIDETTRLLHT